MWGLRPALKTSLPPTMSLHLFTECYPHLFWSFMQEDRELWPHGSDEVAAMAADLPFYCYARLCVYTSSSFRQKDIKRPSLKPCSWRRFINRLCNLMKHAHTIKSQLHSPSAPAWSFRQTPTRNMLGWESPGVSKAYVRYTGLWEHWRYLPSCVYDRIRWPLDGLKTYPPGSLTAECHQGQGVCYSTPQ